MKKYNLIGISLLVSLACFISGCSKAEIPIIGEYEFEDVVYVGISSLTYDALLEKKSGIRYIIESDSLKIIYNKRQIIENGRLKIIDEDSERLFSNISYAKEKMDENFIEANYNGRYTRFIELFSKYEDRYRYSLYDEQGEKISYCIYLLDDEVFISGFAKVENLKLSIDKLTRID